MTPTRPPSPPTDEQRPAAGTPRASNLPTPDLAPTPGPGGEIPLVDHASLVLRAGRMGPVLPHMGWLLRFPDRLDDDELQQEAQRLASSPYALGRRVRPPRLPGGRRRWVATTQAPSVRMAGRPLDGADLDAWLAGELARPLDPEHGFGWQLSAAPTLGGGTIVLLLMHHLFGTAAGMLHAAYGDHDSWSPEHGTTETAFTPTSTYPISEELRGLGERVGLGLLGVGRAATDGIGRAITRPDAAPAVEPPPIRPRRGRDRTRRDPSPYRVGAAASFAAADWDGAAAARGGTGNTLLAAVAANLVRRARANRNGDVGRPVRLVLPIDLGDDAVGGRREGASGPRATMVTASLVLPGGAPQHGDLTVPRRWMKAAFTSDSATAPPVRGAGDATRLLPEALTIQAAKRAALAFDACASNPGLVPPGAHRLGRHVADDCAVVGFPIALDLLVVLSRTPTTVSVTTVADVGRLGPTVDYRAWFAEELAAWGLPESLW